MSSSRAPKATWVSQPVEGDGGLTLQRAAFGLVALAHTDGVHDDEVRLGLGFLARDGLKVGGGKHAGAAAPHLLEVNAGAHVAQEEQAAPTSSRR